MTKDLRGILTTLADAQRLAAAGGFVFLAFVIGMAILAACDAAEEVEAGDKLAA